MDLSSLNKYQKLAVEKFGGPILVFAGAGSGKTRVLTYKIAYLINELGLPPDNILAVTFTNKAAQEMKSRVVDLVNIDISGINIGTFHSVSAQILRKEIGCLGYQNNFTGNRRPNAYISNGRCPQRKKCGAWSSHKRSKRNGKKSYTLRSVQFKTRGAGRYC